VGHEAVQPAVCFSRSDPSSLSSAFTPAVSGVTIPISISNSRSAVSAIACSTASSRLMSSSPSPDRSAATRTFARLRPILSWITSSIWPKSVVTSKLKVWASLASSASARESFRSASYFAILFFRSESFLVACLILVTLLL
jgi:hypothetical protein